MVRAFRASERPACFPCSDCYLGWSYLLLFALVLSQVRGFYYHAQKKRAKLQEPLIAIADMHVIFRRHWNEESFNVMSDHGRYVKTSPELFISDM